MAYTTFIYDVGSLVYILKNPLAVQIFPLGEGDAVIVTWVEYDIQATGENVRQALQNLKAVIRDHFDDLSNRSHDILTDPQSASDLDITLLNLIEAD